jgi:hypothetical protein
MVTAKGWCLHFKHCSRLSYSDLYHLKTQAKTCTQKAGIFHALKLKWYFTDIFQDRNGKQMGLKYKQSPIYVIVLINECRGGMGN